MVQRKPELLRLLADAPGIDQLAALGAPLPAFDVFAPLMSLPRIFGTTLATVPIPIPSIYLPIRTWSNPGQRTGASATPGFKVGIAWQGNRKHLNDRNRSVPLAAFAAAGPLEGVRLFQFAEGTRKPEQLHGATGLFPVTALGDRLNDFADSAAVVCSLDLIVSVDNTALLGVPAGALGAPVWTRLPFWRGRNAG